MIQPIIEDGKEIRRGTEGCEIFDVGEARLLKKHKKNWREKKKTKSNLKPDKWN